MKKYDSSYSIALAILEKMQGGGGGGDCKFTVDITAPDVQGYQTTAKVNYTAKLEGKDGNGAPATGIVAEGQGISDDFGVNPSTTESRQVPVTFTYLGYTAKTVITQDKYTEPVYILGDYFYYSHEEEDKLKEDIENGIITGVTWDDIVANNNEIKAAYPDGWAPRVLSDSDLLNDYGGVESPLGKYNLVFAKILPKFDFSNITVQINQIFQFQDFGWFAVKYFYIPDINCLQTKSMWNLFYDQTELQHVGVIDCSGIDENTGNIDEMFHACSSLKYIGGLRNVHMATRLADCALLTRESVLNIFNSMGNCTSPTRNTWVFHYRTYDLLTPEDIKIATDKGYNVAVE